MNTTYSLNHAVAIVSAGLQSGAIRLNGATTGNANEESIKEDAKYLNGLINAIADNITKRS